MRREHPARGFTLLEMLVVIAIIFLLGIIAAPNARRAYRSYQMENTARQIASMIQRTRYEAIRRNQRLGTAGIWTWTGNPSKFWMDLNGSGSFPFPPGEREPYLQAGYGVFIWPWGFWWWTQQCGIPAGYQTQTVFPLWPQWYRVAFAPRGTVTEENPANPGMWREATGVKVFTIYQWNPPADWANYDIIDTMAIAITPAGRVRVFRWQRVGPGSGCGPGGEWRWVS